MESPNSQMWGARVSLGLLRPTRRARSNPGLLCLRRRFLRYVMVCSFKATQTRGTGQQLAWAHDDGMRAIFARFLKCVRRVARLSMVLGKRRFSVTSRRSGAILLEESTAWLSECPARRCRVSLLCRKIRMGTSPLCRKILWTGVLMSKDWPRRVSPLCRIILPSPPPTSRGPARIGGESGGNRSDSRSAECRRSASHRPDMKRNGAESVWSGGAYHSKINGLIGYPSFSCLSAAAERRRCPPLRSG